MAAAPKFSIVTDALKTRHIMLGRFRLASIAPEFARADPDGTLSERFVQTLEDVPGLADAIRDATFPLQQPDAPASAP